MASSDRLSESRALLEAAPPPILAARSGCSRASAAACGLEALVTSAIFCAPMPLSNAERQRRYIDRLKEQAREATIADEGWSMAKLLPPETGLPMAVWLTENDGYRH